MIKTLQILLVMELMGAIGTKMHANHTEKLWEQHLKMVSQFGCKPQRRSVNVEYILQGNISTAERIIPHYTVLHRCDSGSGCCNKRGDVCSLQQIKLVPVLFLVQNVISKTNFTKFFDLKNHTSCSCQRRRKRSHLELD